MAKDNLQGLAPVLFQTAEQWEQLEEQFSSPTPWATGFAVSALTGIPLIYAVYDSKLSFYGFIDYGESSEHLSEEIVSEELLCQFERPVIALGSLENLDFATICLG